MSKLGKKAKNWSWISIGTIIAGIAYTAVTGDVGTGISIASMGG